jgi:hypothetical protein
MVKENMHVRKASRSVRSDIDHNCKYLKRSPGFANKNLATPIIESSKRGISFGLWKHHVNLLFPELSIRNPDLHQRYPRVPIENSTNNMHFVVFPQTKTDIIIRHVKLQEVINSRSVPYRHSKIIQ